jgi:6-phosphogluconolactonase
MEAVVTDTPGERVRVFQDLEALSRAAAEFLIDLAKRCVASRGRFAVALSGGATPRRLYALLGTAPYCENVEWGRVHVFWADERCVPGDHPESNFKLAADAFLSRVALPKENIHRIKGEEGPGRAAQDYERELRLFFGPASFPVFDLIILGAGEDGHTASLFPGSDSLKERTRLALPVSLEPPKLDRVTLTLPVLDHAAEVLFLVAGRAKAGVVHAIVEKGNPMVYPAGLVRTAQGGLTWFVDRQAASLLRNRAHT